MFPREISVSPQVLQRYVGHYELQSYVYLTISRMGNQLYVRASDADPVEIYPATDKKFFSKVYDTQITFESDANGRTTKLVLHQGAEDLVANRID